MASVIHQVLVSTEFGGAAEIAVRLADHVHRDGPEDALVWIPGSGRAWQKASELALPIASYDAKRLLDRSWIVSGLANLRLGFRLRRLSPGLVHVHEPMRYAAMRHAVKLSGLKTVVHVHIEHDPVGLRWALCHPPDLIITCAAFLEEQVRSALPSDTRQQQRIEVVPNSVDLACFRPGDKAAAKRAVGAPLDRPLLLMLANLAPHKGQATALQAIAALKSRGINVCCWLAGVERNASGAFRAQLAAMIESEGLHDQVRLLGFRNDAPELLRAADILLLPSTHEGLPLTIVEAQATRVAVIAAPTAGIPEVIRDGETGYLVAADDATGYADRIEEIARNPAAMEAVLERAYQQVVMYHNWEGYQDRICELYRELLDGGLRESKRT